MVDFSDVLQLPFIVCVRWVIWSGAVDPALKYDEIFPPFVGIAFSKDPFVKTCVHSLGMYLVVISSSPCAFPAMLDFQPGE